MAQNAFNVYRITANGQAVAAWEQHRARTKYLLDLLRLLQTSGSGMPESHLRQFMPLESLMRSIESLVALGLIEYQEFAPVDRPVPRPQAEYARTNSR
jgi:hypothetical protein